MPLVRVTTNVSSKAIPDNFQAELTSIMSEALQKPKQAIFVDLRVDPNLMMGGERSPCVYTTVDCIGRLKPSSNFTIAKMLDDFFMKNLRVQQAKIGIIFTRVPAQFCSFGGTLFDVGMEYDEDLETLKKK